jgi:2-methylcitrate dehydratase PrpD
VRAAAVCNLRRLSVRSDPHRVRHRRQRSLRIAENFGSHGQNPCTPDVAAENGLVAASLASLGFSAIAGGLEGGRGFFMAAGGGYDAQAILGKLGNPWTSPIPASH